jgi:hypothetical protein
MVSGDPAVLAHLCLSSVLVEASSSGTGHPLWLPLQLLSLALLCGSLSASPLLGLESAFVLFL